MSTALPRSSAATSVEFTPQIRGSGTDRGRSADIEAMPGILDPDGERVVRAPPVASQRQPSTPERVVMVITGRHRGGHGSAALPTGRREPPGAPRRRQVNRASLREP
jgi:hypothetical protein